MVTSLHLSITSCKGAEVKLHVFLTSGPDEGEWSASRSDRFNLGERTPSINLQ